MADETTKRGRTSAGQKILTSSPSGHEELEEQSARETKGDQSVPNPPERKRSPPVHNVTMPQNRNPKHTGRKPRTED